MRKLLEFDERFPHTGEPTVMLVGRSEGGRWYVEKAASYRREGVSEKLASPAFDYIQSVQPRDGKTLILVNALGAYETYGPNRNGDGFNEHPYKYGHAVKCGHEKCAVDGRGWVNEDQTLVRHYGSFEKSARAFRHHRNKLADEAIGRVEKAFWNPRMHRVELLVELDNEKAANEVKRINNGEYLAVSMGCRIKHDRCTKCGHASQARAQYCKHVRDRMNDVDEKTGEIHSVLNPDPVFFDISAVFKPADRTGWTLKKVADAREELPYSVDLGSALDQQEEKRARIQKISDITRALKDCAVMAVNPSPDVQLAAKYRRAARKDRPETKEAIDVATLRKLSAWSIPEVLSTLAFSGTALSTGELTALVMVKAGHAPSPERIAAILSLAPAASRVLEQCPDIIDKLSALVEMNPDLCRAEIVAAAGDWIEKRAGLGDWLRWKVHETGLPFVGRGATVGPGAAYEAYAPPRTDLLTMTDPNTGQIYRTTRGAAMAADDVNQRSLLAGTALLAPLYAYGLGRIPGLRQRGIGFGRALAAGIPLAYGTMKGLRHVFPPYEGDYMTDQGIRLPGNVEFAKASEWAPSTLLLDKLTLDLAETAAIARDDRFKKLADDALSRVADLPDDADPLSTVISTFEGLLAA